MAQNSSCPVNGKRIDQNIVRLVAAHVVLLTVLSISLSNYWIAAFLCLDFFARAAGLPKLSLLTRSSSEILEVLGVGPKTTDAGPKQFAARMGAVVAVLFFSASISHLLLPELLIGGLLSVFATLEAVFGVCVGCYAYHWLPND